MIILIMAEIKKEFKEWQREHPNFMTPNLIDVDTVSDVVIELSEGTDFEQKPLYGVTAIMKTREGFKTVSSIESEPNKPFSDINKAKEYFNQLKEKIKECIEDKEKCKIKI